MSCRWVPTFTGICYLGHPARSTVIMEVAGFPETSILVCQAKRRHVPEDSHHLCHGDETLCLAIMNKLIS